MTQAETAAILTMLKKAYSLFYPKETHEEALETIKLWHLMLKDYDYNIVSKATEFIIATEEKPPTIATLRKKILALTQSETLTPIEAWAKVKKAICNSTYNSREEYEKLPECIQRVVTPQMLKTWANAKETELETVISSNFQKSYAAQTEARKDYELAPEEIKMMIDELKNNVPDLDEAVIKQLESSENKKRNG